jgi:TetR/AcrR family transcriptional regulator, repressor for neighboring sulfatase
VARQADRVRVRRPAAEARRVILEAAEKRLAEGGPDAVRVQLVAADVGVTDAAVHHHFGSREGLLAALLRFAGRRLRAEVLAATASEPADFRRVAERILEAYADRGAARLALWLALAGHAPRGAGMYAPLVDAVHAVQVRRARERGVAPPRRERAQHAVALLNVALVAEPLHGAAFLRSVDLGDDPASRARFRRYLVDALARVLEDR